MFGPKQEASISRKTHAVAKLTFVLIIQLGTYG